MNKRRLARLVDKGFSFGQLADDFCCSVATIRYWLKMYGLKTSFQRGRRIIRKCVRCHKTLKAAQRNGEYCGSFCSLEHKYEKYVSRWLRGEESGNWVGAWRVSNYVRRWLKEKRGENCWKCGWSKKNPVTKRVPVVVNHIDGNAENTCPSNLELLCPNCDSLTSTYCGLNKGNGRKARRDRVRCDSKK